MANPPIDVTVTQEGLRALLAAIRAEEDGKALRKELARNLREALKPAAQAAKSGALSIPAERSHTAPALRPAIARGIVPQARLTARRTGASVKSKRTPRIRGFANAPKRTQSARGWRTQSWGNGQWRVQHGKTNWFDRAMEGVGSTAKQAVHEAMEAMARRIADRTG